MMKSFECEFGIVYSSSLSVNASDIRKVVVSWMSLSKNLSGRQTETEAFCRPSP